MVCWFLSAKVTEFSSVCEGEGVDVPVWDGDGVDVPVSDGDGVDVPVCDGDGVDVPLCDGTVSMFRFVTGMEFRLP
jgi:hypothetical protein